MNATFAALLDVAYAEGGGLLKFGGDALLLLYDGPGHAFRRPRVLRHAARSRTIGRPRTSAGPCNCACTRGSTAGASISSSSARTTGSCSSTGPASTRTVEMESTSEAGEIVVSAETAALLPPEVLGEPKGDGGLLVGEPPGRRVHTDPRRRGHPTRARDPDTAPRPAARGRPVRRRAPERRDRVRALLRPRRGHPDRGRRGGRRRAQRARAHDPGGRGRARGHVPGKRRGPRRRPDHPRLGCTADVRRRRGADPAHAPRGGRLRPAAARSHRDEPRPVLHRPGRRDVPAHLHRARRHCRARGAADGACGRGRDLRLAEAFARGGASFAADELEPFMVKGKSEPVRRTSSARSRRLRPRTMLPSRARRSRSSTANANAPCSTRRSHQCGWASGRSSS